MTYLKIDNIIIYILSFLTKTGGLFGVYTNSIKMTLFIVGLSYIVHNHNDDYLFLSSMKIYLYFLFISLLNNYFTYTEGKQYMREGVIDRWMNRNIINHLLSILLTSIILIILKNDGHLYFLFSIVSLFLFIFFFYLLAVIKLPKNLSSMSKKIFGFFSPALLFITPIFWWPNFSDNVLTIKDIFAISSPIFWFIMIFEFILINISTELIKIFSILICACYLYLFLKISRQNIFHEREKRAHSSIFVETNSKYYLTPVSGFNNIKISHLRILFNFIGISIPYYIENSRGNVSNLSATESLALRLHIIILLGNSKIF